MDWALIGVESFEEKEGEIMETNGTLRESSTGSSAIVYVGRVELIK